MSWFKSCLGLAKVKFPSCFVSVSMMVEVEPLQFKAITDVDDDLLERSNEKLRSMTSRTNFNIVKNGEMFVVSRKMPMHLYEQKYQRLCRASREKQEPVCEDEAFAENISIAILAQKKKKLKTSSCTRMPGDPGV